MAEKIALIIVNNEVLIDGAKDTRKGADKDKKRMCEMFSELGFRIIDRSDQTAVQIEDEFKKACSTPCDCFVFVISTHGEEIRLAKESITVDVYDQMILGTDGQPVSVNRLLKLLDNETLKGKTKLCFIQACRSIEEDQDIVKYDPGVKVEIFDQKQDNANASMRQNCDTSDKTRNMPLSNNAEDALVKAKSTTEQSPKSTWPTNVDWRNVGSNIHEADEDVIDTRKGESSAAPPHVPHVPVVVAPVDCPRDCLIMYAVQPQKVALRNTEEGSWMFHFMFEQREDLKNGDGNILPYLTSVLNCMALKTCRVKINYKFKEVKMCGTIYHRLTRNVYLKPLAI